MEEQLVNSQKVAEILSIDGRPISRQRVSQIAKLRGWERHLGSGEGCPWLYRRADVETYAATRRNGRPPRVFCICEPPGYDTANPAICPICHKAHKLEQAA